MKLKTYRVDRIETALRLAKVELGAEAAMVDSKTEGERLAVTFSVGGSTRPAHWREYQGGGPVEKATTPAPPQPVQPAPKSEYQARREPEPTQPREQASAPSDRMAELLDELERESRRRSESLFQPIFRDAALGRLFSRLAARGFSPESAAQLTASLESRAADGATFEELTQRLGESLQRLWLVDPGPRNLPSAGGSQASEATGAPALAVVGSAGSGKTTTLAKIAMRYGSRERKRIRFLSVDPFRIGAVETLEAYAALLDSPLTVVDDPRELPNALDELRRARPAPDWILVDTAGYGPAESDRERRLREALAVCSGLEAHWTLSATERPGRAARVAPSGGDATDSPFVSDALIFTRMDETTAPGAIFDESLRLALPISFLTAGQSSLRDLIPADAATLTRFALGAGDEGSERQARAAVADDGTQKLSPRG